MIVRAAVEGNIQCKQRKKADKYLKLRKIRRGDGETATLQEEKRKEKTGLRVSISWCRVQLKLDK